MMLSESLNSDTIFFELKEVAEGPHLPQVTSVASYPIEQAAQQTKHPLLVLEQDEDASMQPPSKRVGTSRQFRRIPCKARGMSNKHNSDTAFLNVPMDAPHGLLLSCSHPECAESGKKFCYCIVCASPVAKRNFPKRHGHGLIESAKDLKVVDYTSSFIEISSVEEETSCHPCIEQTVSAPILEKPRHRRVVSYDDAATYATQSLATRPATDSLLSLSATQQQWLDLLHKCPGLEQKANMTSWMDKVICFSEEKESALRMAPVVPICTIMEHPHFAPVLPSQQRDTILSAPPLPATVPIEDEPSSSPSPAHDSFPKPLISPFESNIDTFDETPKPEDSLPVDQFLSSLELDDVDFTNFFDEELQEDNKWKGYIMRGHLL